MSNGIPPGFRKRQPGSDLMLILGEHGEILPSVGTLKVPEINDASECL